ncbi:MAG: hypothetical protein L3J06_03280 [Cyclobacteriaceae bacterium]|nr:hypothetical protein [Cyclobacteriaceae bacterium]
MTRSILFFIIVISFSCTEIVFDAPQPPGGKDLTEIPNALIGSYSFVVLNEQEAIHITKNYFDGDEGKKYLSDSLILRKMGNKYVINQLINKEGETKGKWSVYTFEEKGCGFLKATAFIISEDEYLPTFMETYNGTQVGGGQEKQIIINLDSKEAFNKLSKDREATLAIILEKMEE